MFLALPSWRFEKTGAWTTPRLDACGAANFHSDYVPPNHPAHYPMPKLKDERPAATFRDEAKRKEQYAVGLAEIQPDLDRIEAELDDCQRLNEEDFTVRINARD